jgi:hypothetical protein
MLVRTSKNKDNPYVMLHKGFLEDMNLSLKAKGLLAYCMSKPDGWQFNLEQMTTCLKEGIDALQSAFKELIDNSYCIREKPRSENGTYSNMEYTLYEQPLKIKVPQPGFPGVDVPGLEVAGVAPYISNNEPIKYDDDDPCASTHARVGCGNVHKVAGLPKQSILVEKLKPNGQKVQCSQEEYFKYCINTHKDFKTEEILDAWSRFLGYQGRIGDWMKYIDQIIINKRQDAKICNTQKVSEESKKIAKKNTSENSKENISETTSKEPPLVRVRLPFEPPNSNRLVNGLKPLKTSWS